LNTEGPTSAAWLIVTVVACEKGVNMLGLVIIGIAFCVDVEGALTDILTGLGEGM
jgi:hypothetical protein